MAIPFSDAVGSEGRVHAIEANEAIADVCERNVRARAGDNNMLHRAAAWDYPTASRGVRVRTLAADEIDLQRPLSAIKVNLQGPTCAR